MIYYRLLTTVSECAPALISVLALIGVAAPLSAQKTDLLVHQREMVTTLESPASLVAGQRGEVIVALPRLKQILIVPRPGEGEITEIDLGSVASEVFPSRIGWDGTNPWGLNRDQRHLIWFDSLWSPMEERAVLLPERGDGVHGFRPLALLGRDYALIETSGNLLGMVAAHDGSEVPTDAAVPSGPIPYLPLWLTTLENEVVDTIALFTTRHRFAFIPLNHGNRAFTVVEEPFTDHPIFGVDPTGTHLAIVERAVSERPDHFILKRRHLRNEETRTVRFPIQPQRLPRKEVLATLDMILTNRSLIGVGRDELEARLYIPAWRPYVTAVKVGPDGAVWLRREIVHSAQQVIWEVIDGQDKRLGYLELPADIALVAVNAGEAWGLQNATGDSVRQELWYLAIESPVQ